MKFFRKIFNTLKEGIKGIWKHKNLGFVSVTSTFFTLFIIGIIVIITISINNMALQVQGKVNDVEIYIVDGATQVQIYELEDKINAIDIPKTVQFRSSEDALQLMKDSWGDDAELLESMEAEGLLPASFIVELENIDQADSFVNQISNEPNVEDVNYYKDLVDQIYRVSNYVKIFGALLVLILMVVSIFIISNTIRLTVISRIDEIAVMKNVGATNNYIRIPFVIEGIFFGLIAAALSYIAIYFLYEFVFYNFGARIADNFSIVSLLRPELFRRPMLEIFLSLGLGIGTLGSILSIRRYLVNREVNYVK